MTHNRKVLVGCLTGFVAENDTNVGNFFNRQDKSSADKPSFQDLSCLLVEVLKTRLVCNNYLCPMTTHNSTARPRILVTGANGQLGQELHLLAPAFPQYEFNFLSRSDMPLHHFEGVRQYFDVLKPQYCINCAAYTAVDKAETEQDLAFLINAEATGVLAAVCAAHGTQLIHISTDYVFGGTAAVPYKETDTTGPVSVYGASKLKGEELVLEADASAVIIRTAWVYSQFGKNFVKTMKQLMSERAELNIVNDQWGAPTWAGGLAAAILEVVAKIETKQHPVSGIYHYSDDGLITWFDFAMAIKELLGSACVLHGIPTSAYPTPAQRPVWSALDKEKIKQLGVTVWPWKAQLEKCWPLLV
jgi:dTDP-4-dehydrorhamnose reductase